MRSGASSSGKPSGLRADNPIVLWDKFHQTKPRAMVSIAFRDGPKAAGAILMFKTSMRTAQKKPRLLGELGDLSHEKVNSSEFKYSKGTEIFGQAEAAEYIYQLLEGAVRTHKLLSDGRRQIGAFHLPGDIFGLDNGDFHRFTAEAITDTHC